jgi:CubicO group peptidase (beta-lactamase class C family)
MVNDGKLANVVTLVARHGEIVNCDAYGVLDISTTPPVPVKTDSIFRVASMTKPITAAAMMMLWEEGKWAFEDPVSKFIPEFEGLKVRLDDGELVPQALPMTMKQLMSHSAGIGTSGEYSGLRDGDPAAAKTSQGLQSYFWSGGYGTWVWIDPVNDMIVIGFINNANSANSSRLAAMLLMGRHLGKLAYKALNESSRNEAENID